MASPVTRAAWSLAAVAALAFALLRIAPLASDPDVPLLVREGGAEWVFYDLPYELRQIAPRELVFGFRTRFHVDAVPKRALLTVRAFREAKIKLDGRLLSVPRDESASWREPYEIELAPELTRGDHELAIFVRHTRGPPGVLAYCDALGIHTDGSWEGTIDAQRWVPVRTADDVPMTEHRSQAPTGPQALGHVAWILAIAAAIGAALASWRPPRASIVRIALLGAWAVLIVHNFFALDPNQQIGFDAEGHVAYILLVTQEHRLPLANEGWQMFQAPLYYIVAAVWQAISSALLQPDMAARMLRLVPMLCGMAQVEIVFRTLRTVLPERQDLQSLGTIVGALLPMNLYISQSPGNEPMAAALTASTIGIALAVQYGSDRCRSIGWLCLLGAVLGLAVLAKSTALLLVPAIGVWLAAVSWRRGKRLSDSATSIACVFGAAAIVGGWYYARNWVVLGKPFVGGWDPSRGIEWWQFPGFRTARSVLSFGDALIHPAAAHTMGFFDTMYATFWCDGFLGSSVEYAGRPPWNESFLFAGPILALFPSALIALGAIRGATNRSLPWRGAVAWSAALVAIYFAAVLDLYLRVPIYSAAKATYTSGLTPAYALLFAAGADVCTKRALGRTLTFALLAAWMVAAYAAFFVTGR